MAIYADLEDLEDTIEGFTVDDPAAAERYLERAERDIDALIASKGPSDSPQVLTGTGTIVSSGVNVSGLGTKFLDELDDDATFEAAGQVRIVETIISNLTLRTTTAFSPALAGAEFVITRITGLKLNPLTDIESWQAEALARAVCRQAYYRMLVGEKALARPAVRESGPDFSHEPIELISRQARYELATTGLLRTTTRAVI